MAAATWLLNCGTLLSLKLTVLKRGSEGINRFKNISIYGNSDDILELDLDVEELNELRHMTIRPRVREVMDNLIGKLAQEGQTMKNNIKGQEAMRTKWTDVVKGTRKRNENATDDNTRSIPTIHTTQIGKVQVLPNRKKKSVSRSPKSTICPVSSESIMKKTSAKHKILLIGDSHTRSCASKLQEQLKEQYEVLGYVIPGAGAAVLTKTAQQEIRELSEEDIIIYFGGTNDIAKNNSSKGISLIHQYALANYHTKIIFIEAPHRHDLMETSIINKEVKIYNRKLNKLTSKYKHTSTMHFDLQREDFTRHGLHLRNAGKDKLLTLLSGKIKMQRWKAQLELDGKRT
jgi:hypothetical protein